MVTEKVASTFIYAHHMCRVFNRFFFVLVSTEVSASVSGSHHIFTAEGKITSLLKQQQKKKEYLLSVTIIIVVFRLFLFFFFSSWFCAWLLTLPARGSCLTNRKKEKKKLFLCVCLLLSCAPTQVSGIRKGKQDCFLFFFLQARVKVIPQVRCGAETQC